MTAQERLFKALEGELEEKSETYYMFVHKSKQKGFTYFLKNLGFKSINYTLNGAFIIYELNVENNSYIKRKLDDNQPKFLKAN